MSDLINDAHTDLAEALAGVLPGRVHPYRPDRTAVAAAPAIWVDRVDTAPTTVGAHGATALEATIIVTVDGATAAAQQLRAALHAACHDAVIVAGWQWQGATNTTFDASPDVTLFSLEVAVSTVTYNRTFCLPDPPAAVPIPKPSLVEV